MEKIADLKPYPGNARVGDVEMIAESLQQNAQFRPIVVQRSTGYVLAGNHTMKAAQSLGWDQIDVHWLDCDDETARRVVLVDNRANDVSTYDDHALLALIQSVGESTEDLLGTGFQDQDLLDLIASLDDKHGWGRDVDDVPDLDEETISGLGDIWLCGPHRVMCGDATSAQDMRALMAGSTAAMVWTDPPSGTAAGAEDLLEDWVMTAYGLAAEVCEPGAVWFVLAPPGPDADALSRPLAKMGIWKHTLIWVKDRMSAGRADYHYQHEQMFYGWTAGTHAEPAETESSVWNFAKAKRTKEHPDVLPVALIEKAVENHTEAGDVILDMFAGTGSTLVAAHTKSRVAYCMEIDPRYADVICRRYQESTGDKPVLEASGEITDFAAH